MLINPCLECGACCAFFRASFYWAESDLAQPMGVPSELTDKLNDFRLFMQGTNGSHPRCIALMALSAKKSTVPFISTVHQSAGTFPHHGKTIPIMSAATRLELPGVLLH